MVKAGQGLSNKESGSFIAEYVEVGLGKVILAWGKEHCVKKHPEVNYQRAAGNYRYFIIMWM